MTHMRHEWTPTDRVHARIKYARLKSEAAYNTFKKTKRPEDEQRWQHYVRLLVRAYDDLDHL